ncbi:MAG: DUF115 domain-containing protein [Nitrosopumilaceae archaeon]|nr:DUF115 domain-containing protein [Nitrosopumilaceae archaeon]
MSISGWERKYAQIIEEFDYNEEDDEKSAKLLNSLLKSKPSIEKLKSRIENRTVFVVGAGPSVSSSIHILKKFQNVTKIVADGAAYALIKNNVEPDIIVTDLDGCDEYINNIKDEIVIVHAHGDNYDKLKLVTKIKNCIGTTETKPFGNIYNFGGFTDGDRCVFLAAYFHAKKIILFGMDFGNVIGEYSKKTVQNKLLKIKKMKKAKDLLEWLATGTKIKFYTTSSQIKGFTKINYNDIKNIIRSEF